MKKTLFCLVALAAVLLTGCKKEEPDLRTVKVMNQQLVINSTIKDYYDISIVYTLPDTVELKETLTFQKVSDSFLPEIYKKYKAMTEFGDLYGCDFVRETKNAGAGKCQLVFTRNQKAYDTDKTDYAYIIYRAFYAGEQIGSSILDAKTISQMNVDGYNLENMLKPIMNQINSEVHDFTFTNPLPTKE